MAKNNTPTQEAPTAKVQPPAASMYTAADLTDAARTRFGVPPEVVKAALRDAGKDKVTMAEAREIVMKFMKREVK